MHLTRATASKSSIVLSGPGLSAETEIVGYTGPVINGTEIARWTFGGEEHPEVEVKANTEISITFGDGPAATAGVIAFLCFARDHIRDKVFPKLEPFL